DAIGFVGLYRHGRFGETWSPIHRRADHDHCLSAGRGLCDHPPGAGRPSAHLGKRPAKPALTWRSTSPSSPEPAVALGAPSVRPSGQKASMSSAYPRASAAPRPQKASNATAALRRGWSWIFPTSTAPSVLWGIPSSVWHRGPSALGLPLRR